MLIVFFVVILCVLFAFGLYAGLMSSGVLPGQGRSERSDRSDRPRTFGYGSSSGIFPRVPHLRELPQGCLIALIVASTLWFLAWGVILVLAVSFLRDTT
ncbi:MAG: hypothetical protein ACR2K0_10320 [Acidimicrobiales bacterium]